MRVIFGRFGGRKLIVPSGYDIRPTSDKIRGAIFNILRSRGAITDNCNVLDIFCGTGALGIEALSQGAGFCAFIDKARKSLDLARDNVSTLGISKDDVHFMVRDAGALLERPKDYPRFDLVFLDPPYRRNLVGAALSALDKRGWLAQDACLVVETESRGNEPLPAHYKLEDERIYGDTKVMFITYQASVPE